MKRIFVFVFVIFTACSSDDETQDPVFCTEEYKAGLEIIIKNESADIYLKDRIKVLIVDGEYSEELISSDNSTNTFYGAYERPGEYDIIISSKGYQTYKTPKPIIVAKDACHVITKIIEVELEPEINNK